jgi:hypothetical protein
MGASGKLWIRVDSDIPRDPRIGSFAAAMAIHPAHALGMVLKVWCAMSEHAPDGDLSAVPDAMIEEWAGASGLRRMKPGIFAHHFAQSFLDENRREARFAAAQEPVLEYRRKARERMARNRQDKSETFAVSSRTMREQIANDSDVRNGTIRNGTERHEEEQNPVTERGRSNKKSTSQASLTLGGANRNLRGEGMRVFGKIHAAKVPVVTQTGTHYYVPKDFMNGLDSSIREVVEAVGGAHVIANADDDALRILRSQFAEVYASSR